MGLSLTAEQKSIFDIFSGENQYIIPPYQRPYSWNEEQCIELFEDLKKAFYESKDDGYFLGNIVIAKSRDEKNRLEVIDGQQRLITLTLFIKVLSILDDDNSALKNAILIKDRRTDKEIQRLKTNVFEEKDAKFLEEVLNMSFDGECINIDKKENQFKKNICYFYKELKEFQENNNIQEFSDFLTDDVYLLPIESEGSNKDKAREKALKIFETINDRGLNLSDSDIFKAKLYSIALNKLKQDDFIEKWKELDKSCHSVNYSIDRIFKIYTHIIRGEKGIKSSEIGLREFFTQKEYSPFNSKSYEDILDDLFNIIYSIEFYKDVIEKPLEYPELAKWFQLINEYTNDYPLITLLIYLYKNDDDNEENLIEFTKNLIRYAYFQGSTTKIKSYIYEIIINILHNKGFEYPLEKEDITKHNFEYFGRLKSAFTLLTFYLQENQNAIYPYYFDKIVNSKDVDNLGSSWSNINYYEYVDSIGNMLVTDLPKRNLLLNTKKKYFQKSKLKETKELIKKFDNWTYSKYQKREDELVERLLRFFKNED